MSLLIFKYDGFYIANTCSFILDFCGFFCFLFFGEILVGVDADILTGGDDGDGDDGDDDDDGDDSDDGDDGDDGD
jgi:hypothetical protein